MQSKELFELVMDKDEEILKAYKPDKLRAWFSYAVSTLFIFICLLPIAILSSLAGEYTSMWVTIIILAVYLVVSIIMMYLWCNKTIYAATNKRVLIRTGFIGVDYKSLDYTLLGALTVNVSWMDKILRKDTGCVSFGSMASPMTSNTTAKFQFSYIKNPYQVYREVKEIIDTNKENKIDK